MKAVVGVEEKIYLDLQKKLDSYESSMSNSIDSDVWNFDFESYIFPVDFSFRCQFLFLKAHLVLC